jgi:hypothetical protein
MTFIRKPFLPRCNWRDCSCANMMFLILEGCAELVSLPLELEFTSLHFSGESLDLFNHADNFRAWSDQLSALICTRGSGIPASQSSCSFCVHFGIAALYPPGPSLCLNLFFDFSSFILLWGLWLCSGMLLYECVPFIWRDISKLIQWRQTPLHIVLVESMFEPPKCIRCCFHRSIFVNLFFLRREKCNVLWWILIMFLACLLKHHPGTRRSCIFPCNNTTDVSPFRKNTIWFNSWPICVLHHYPNNVLLHFVQGSYPPQLTLFST